MAVSGRQLLDSLSRVPFIGSAELAGILGEPHATVHRALTDLMADGIVGGDEPWDRPPAFEPEVPSDNQWHPCSRLVLQRQFREGCGVMRAWRRGA